MNPKELDKLAELKQEMKDKEEPAETNPLTETLDYHEHMEQRHKDAGHKVMDAMFGSRREKVEAWADQIEGRGTYESWAEKIVENKNAYYVAGQKLWLASEDGKHQTNPVIPVIDGFIEEQLGSENEAWRNLRDNNPKGFAELQNRLSVFVGRKMEDTEFTPEDQHHLKFRALIEFIEEEQPVPAWRVFNPLSKRESERRLVKSPVNALDNEKLQNFRRDPHESEQHFIDRYRREVAPYKNNIQTESYAEALWSEGFIKEQDEWDKVQDAVRSTIIKKCQIGRDLYGNDKLALTYRGVYGAMMFQKLERYQMAFQVAIPKIDELCSKYRTSLKDVAQNSFDSDQLSADEIESLAEKAVKERTLSLSDCFLDRLSREIGEDVSDEAAKAIREVKIEDNNSWIRRHERDSVASKALGIGCDLVEHSASFFKPVTFEKESGYFYESKNSTQLSEGLEHITNLRESIDDKNDESEKWKNEADEAIKEYLALAERTGMMKDLLSSKFDLVKRASKIVGFNLDIEQYVPDAIIDIKYGLKSIKEIMIRAGEDKGRGTWTKDTEDIYRDELCFESPRQYFSTSAGIPTEVRDKYADEFRYASYSGFIGMMRVARSHRFDHGNRSRNYYNSEILRARHAAQDYYSFFNYSEHADEFRKFMEENGHLADYDAFMNYSTLP